MPLVRKMYRGGKVWAEVDDAGQLVSEHGLTKIRYREEDDRTYSARAEDVLDVDEGAIAAAREERARASSAAKKEAADARGGAGDPDTLVLYTDGACYGNPGPAGVGFLMEWRGHRKEVSRFLGEGTNNLAELTAIRDALAAVRRRSIRVRLYTDSSYALGVLDGGWKAQQHRDLIDEIRGLMGRFRDLELLKVKGHSGDPGNERADQLARDGIDQASSESEADERGESTSPSGGAH